MAVIARRYVAIDSHRTKGLFASNTRRFQIFIYDSYSFRKIVLST